MDLAAAVERLHLFSQSWNDADVVDEGSGLTGADLRLIVEHSVVPAPRREDGDEGEP